MDDFLSLYQRYVSGNTEAPKLFHTWCAISGIASMLGKNFWLTRGHFKVYPNLYVMLIGTPGTGKGTCINILQSLLLEAGYRTFAADRSSKEKFLLDFQDGFSFSESGMDTNSDTMFSINDFLSQQISGPEVKEVFILAEEFNDFIGTNNADFISILTKLWSYQGPYRNRLKNSKSVILNDPCVNILGGNTSAGFALAFPPEIIGQGFLARLLPIYGEPTGRKISFPDLPDSGLRTELVERFVAIRRDVRGEATLNGEAKFLLDRINQEWQPLIDGRFQHYTTRRFNQLIKICLGQAASRGSTEITCDDIKNANTILSHTEDLMPKAIGEFGKAKNSDVTSKIMEALYTTSKPLSTTDIWKIVRSDLNSIAELANILSGLQVADKIQSIKGVNGWLPKLHVSTTVIDLTNPEMKRTIQ